MACLSTNIIIIIQCCDLETMVSRLECTRVHFVQVSVLVSRPKQGLDNNTDIIIIISFIRTKSTNTDKTIIATIKLQLSAEK